MAELEAGKSVSLPELMVSTLAMTDALAKLLIEKGVIMEAEFKQKLLQERPVYQHILNPTVQQTNENLPEAARAPALGRESAYQARLHLQRNGAKGVEAFYLPRNACRCKTFRP